MTTYPIQFHTKARRVAPGFLSYFLVTFFVLFSGGAATYGLFPYWMVAAMPIAIIYSIRKKIVPNTNELVFLLLSVLVLFGQFIVFRKPALFLTRPISLVFVMFVSARFLKQTFLETFINVIFFFSICSLVFLSIDVLGGRPFLLAVSNALPQLGAVSFSENVGTMHTLYLYNINEVLSMYGYMRNPGPFWEPGRFAIFLDLALALNVFRDGGKLFSKKNIVFIITIITTFSTTAYIALSFIFFGSILLSSRSGASKALLIIILIPAIYYVLGLDFMQSKVMNEMSDMDVESSRFGAIAYHWLQIRDSPLVGYGPYLTAVYGDSLEISPNGWSDLVRYFGFPLATFMFFSLFFSAPAIIRIGKYRRLKQLFIFLVIITVAFTQTVMYSPFYYLLYFFALNKSTDNRLICQKTI